MTVRRVFIVAEAFGPTDALIPVLTRAGFGPPVSKSSLADVAEHVRGGQVDLLVVPLSIMQGRGRLDLESLLREAPGMGSIGTAPMADAELILTSMRSGVGEFLVAPCTPTDVESALGRLQRKWGAAPVRGSVTAVYTPKGGVGATTVAVNLAYALATRRANARAAIVDLNMGLGDVNTYLNLHCDYDVGDLARKLDQADNELMHSIVTPFGDGLFALPATDDLESAEGVQANAVTRILLAFRGSFTHTVVDCEHSFGPRTVAALDAADRIVLVLQSNVATIRAVKRTLSLFQQLDYRKERVTVVLNREGPGDVLSRQDIMKTLDRTIDVRLPNAFQLITESQTQGIPIAQASNSATITQAFEQLATAISGEVAQVETESEKPGNGPLSRFFGKGRK